MFKLIWLSDPHFTATGTVLGYTPSERLSAAVDFINAHHSDAALCVISGDMVNRGTEGDYAALGAALGRLVIPYFPLAGNHDDRSLLRPGLPVPETCMPEFIQYTIDTPEGLIACLDTHMTGSDAGEFCTARRDWLASVLQDAVDRPVYLFMHHPPMALGLPMQDTENLQNGTAFLDLIAGFDNIRYLFIGHVHRPITGTVRGIPFATMRSVLYQAPAPHPAWDWDSFKPAEEAPNLGVVTLDAADVNLQYIQFCAHDEGFTGA